MPEPELRRIPPVGLGSGKLGTPWERMHSENGSNWPKLEAALSEGLDEPHAVSATTHMAAATDVYPR